MSEKLKKLEEKGLKVEKTTVKRKRKLSGVPGSVKESVCNRLGDYLKVINFLGDDFMSQRQFVEFCYALKLVEKDDRDTKITAIINDLVKADLVKKTRIGVTNAKMLLLTKYAKRWLIGAITSQEVAATKKYKSDKPYLKSIMRMDYFLHELMPIFSKREINDLDKIKEILANNKNSLFLKRKESEKFYKRIMNDVRFKYDLKNDNIKAMIYWCNYRLAVDKQRLNHPLSEFEKKVMEFDSIQNKSGSSAIWHQLKYNLDENAASTKLEIIRREDIYVRTLYELINRDVVIHSVAKHKDYYLINFKVFDAYNNADVNKIERSIMATIHMFRAMFKEEVPLRFSVTIHVFNDNMKDRINRAINQRLEKESSDREKAIKYRYYKPTEINFYSMNLHSRYLLTED